MAKLKLNAQMIENICEGIRNGNYAKTVCQAVGIDESTYYRWLQRGEKSQKGIYCNFYQSLKKAEAEGEQLLLNIIRMAAKDTWTAAAWILERKHPDRYGKREKIEHEFKGVKVEIDLIPEQEGAGD